MMTAATPTPVFGVLPAAGMSRRMGTPKQSLPYGSSTMTGHVARTMLAANLNAVVVVTRTELVDVIDLPADPRLIVSTNDDPTSQMMDSIRLGLDRLEDAPCASLGPHADAGVLVIPADMPRVTVDACRACVSAFREHPQRIVIATCHGSRGHPIVFPLALRPMLGELAGGLNELSIRRADLVLELPIDNADILGNVNTREDYRRLAE